MTPVTLWAGRIKQSDESMSVAETVSRGPSTAGSQSPFFDYDALDRVPLEKEPFDYVIVEHFVRPERFVDVVAAYPQGLGPGSHPVDMVKTEGNFTALIDELHGDRFRNAVERKFDLDLTGLPTACTVRAATSNRDGYIHTDSKSKVITVLLYLNEAWNNEGGRLRLLRSGTDLEDFVAEVKPTEGTLLIFRRSDTSWHGHKPFIGPRKAIQFNWVTSQTNQVREKTRHTISHAMKRIGLDGALKRLGLTSRS